MKDLLYVIVLFQFVDQRQHLGCLILGQFNRDGAYVFMLSRQRRNTPRFERFPRLGRNWLTYMPRMTSCGSALLPAALSHLLQTVIDQVELEPRPDLLTPRGSRRNRRPSFLNKKLDYRRWCQDCRRPLAKIFRTLATVRVGLSVAVSTRGGDANAGSESLRKGFPDSWSLPCRMRDESPHRSCPSAYSRRGHSVEYAAMSDSLTGQVHLRALR